MLRLVLLMMCIAGSTALQAQKIEKWKATQLLNYINDTSGTPVKVVNIWATFCKPCIKEIPFFIKVADQYKEKTSLLLVSVDLPSAYPKAIRKMAREKKFTTPIVWLDETNADYFCPMVSPDWSGSIPATLVVNTSTGFKHFVEEEMTEPELVKIIEAALNSSK